MPVYINESNERMVLDAIRSGRLSADESGAVWRRQKRGGHGLMVPIDPPVRADIAGCQGYLRVVLGNVHVRAHRVVWMALRGPIADGLEINHRNGVHDDNRIGNLELATRAENQLHSARVLGNVPRGEVASGAILDCDAVTEIRRRFKSGDSRKTLANEFGVSYGNVRAIVSGKSWSHLPDSPRKKEGVRYVRVTEMRDGSPVVVHRHPSHSDAVRMLLAGIAPLRVAMATGMSRSHVVVIKRGLGLVRSRQTSVAA